jgi:hypothetical protein
MDALEDFVASRCEQLFRDGKDLVEMHTTAALQEAATMVNNCIDAERAERMKSLEEEQHRSMERQKALARALGEELEASVVSQAVAEVRASACAAAREEACERFRAAQESGRAGASS